ncbi:MAG: decaprenyl-phosphate phosphoribosyltransferase [Planctomycetaceae bacterium]
MTHTTFHPAAEATRFTRALALSLRPHQWVKNFLVFGGLIFSRSMSDPIAVLHCVHAFLLFCFAASSIYLLNDVNDIEEDRRHPTKRLRPVAAGLISRATAIGVMLFLAVGSVGSAFTINRTFGVVLAAYVLMNLAYSLNLKRVVILDVMLIAIGFVLRAIGGAVAIGVPASSWLVLCTLTLALLVGFGKRRNELAVLQGNAKEHRSNLEEYSLPFLDLMMTISGGAAVVMYALYTTASANTGRAGSPLLSLTTPFVMYGIFRYLYLVHRHSEGGDPSKLFVSDRPFVVNGVLWVLACCCAIYGPTHWAIW